MASKQDIITAIKNSGIFLRIPELQGAKPRLKVDGNPFAIVGGFNMVFQLEHQNKKWAFRVWHVPMGENIERYRKISKYLSEKKLSYFANFIYDEKGILVNGILLDTIRMEWLEGILLKDYIEKNLNDKPKLERLANDFLEMSKTLRANKISHGDLQEGNLLVDDSGKISLVDYDSICIPEIEGQSELVTGLKGYQHPSRFKNSKASLKADYFSELIIYLSILGIAKKTELWEKYQVKDTCYLLFTETDFKDFENSEIYKDLQKLSDTVKSLTRILSDYLKESNYLNLIGFENYLTKPNISLNVSKNEILQGKPVELSWNIENVDTFTLNNGTENTSSNTSSKSQILITPTQTTTYKLIAENAFGKSVKEITIKVLPLPKIKDFRSKNPKNEFSKETELIWDIENADKIELYYAGNLEVLSNKGSKIVSPSEDTKYKLIITALDGLTKEEKEIKIQVFKRIIIEKFTTDLEFVVETLGIELNWHIENASSIKLCSNIGKEIDVTKINTTTVKPKRNQYFYLRASNDLFSVESKKIQIEVQNLPTIPPLPIFPSGKELIPIFKLDFSLNVDSILTDTQISFQKAVKKNKRFGLFEILKRILKK